MMSYLLWEGANQGWLKPLGLGYFESRLKARYYLKPIQGKACPWSNRVESEIRLLRRDFSGAYNLARDSLELKPDDPLNLSWLAYVLIISGRPLEAIPYGHEAIKNDPANPALHFSCLGLAYLSMGQVQEALALFDKTFEKNPYLNSYKAAYAVALFYSGKREEARKLLEQYKSLWPVLPNLRRVMFFWPFQDSRAVDFFAQGLIGARLPGMVSDCLYCLKEHKLNSHAIRASFFGKTMSGFDPWTGRQEWVRRDRDGKAILFGGRNGQDVIDRGHSRIEKDNLCDCWEKRTAGIEIGGPVYRNAKGDREQMDEFILFTDYGFSPVSPA